jgi:hypothetical protein
MSPELAMIIGGVLVLVGVLLGHLLTLAAQASDDDHEGRR